MRITLKEGARTAEIIGDDDLIRESISYQYTFERNTKLMIEQFYGTAQGDVSEHVDNG